MDERADLERAIAVLETQRALLGDAVVDASLAALREKLAALERAPAESQRKLVTVLFADVAAFTSMAEKHDPEDVAGIMHAYFERWAGVIAGHGGRVEKFIGDAVVGIFGAPVAREDDPERAVRAALAMRAGLDELNGELARDWGVRLAMRVGVNTGLVFAGVQRGQDLSVLGDAVNVASRLQTAAPVGEILISQDTYRHVRGLFDVVAQPPLTVKGKAEPLQAYLVRGARPAAFRPATRGVEGLETRMIGRAAELGRLQGALRAVLEGGTARAVTVVGEPGVGKSRLLYEFERWLETLPGAEPVRVFRGRATETMLSLPYSLLRSVAASRFEIAESDPPETAREKLVCGVTGLLAGDAEGEKKAHFIGHLLGLDFHTSPHLQGILEDTRQIRSRALSYLGQFFMAQGRGHPAVFLLEDLHWADDDSLDALALLMQAARALPLLWVGAARPGLFERRPGWGHSWAARVDLAPLSPDESRALVAEILRKVPAIPAALSDLVLARAEGNPFYVEELIKMLIDARVIATGGAEWRVDTAQLAEARIPQTLTGVLQARLDRLAPAERKALQAASVVGRVFWDTAVAYLAEERQAATGVALEALESKELIHRRGQAAFAGADEFAFKHVLMRDVTYETVLKRVRGGYHTRAAEWLAARSGERAGEYAGIIAGHLEAAGESAQAAEWYGRAGEHARKSYAPEAAIALYRKALDLVAAAPAPVERKLAWYAGVGWALKARARYADAVEAYTSACTAAKASGDPAAQAHAWNDLASAQESRGDFRDSQESAACAEVLAREAGGAGWVELADALLRQSQAAFRLGEIAQALDLAGQGLALCEAAEPAPDARRLQARALNLLGAAHVRAGQFAPGMHCREQALALYRDLDNRQGMAMVLNNLATGAGQRGDHATAAQRLQEALAIMREMGDRDGELLCLQNLGNAQVQLGQFVAAEESARRCFAMLGTTRWWLAVDLYCCLADACVGQGKLAESLQAARQALSLAEESGSQSGLGMAWQALGHCSAGHAEAGHLPSDVPDPAACYAESLNAFAACHMESARAYVLRDWARYELARGERARGAEMWREARALFERLAMPLEVQRMDGPDAGR